MKMNRIRVTRRSKIGFGYNTKPTGNGTEIEETTQPDHTGTVRQVVKKIANDPHFQSLKGGTFYTTAWFVRSGRKWRRVSSDNWQTPIDLIHLSDFEDHIFLNLD